MGAVAKHESEAAFDYAALTGNVATAAREAADRIRERIRGQQVAIFDIGRDLIAMKETLGHGHFLAWVAAEFGMSDRTARSFMQVADVLGSKSEIVSDLPPTVLYQLSAPSTPEPVRDEVIQRIEEGERLPPDEIRFKIKEARAAERKAAADAKLTKGQKNYRKRVLRDHEAEAAARAAERQRRVEAANNAVAMVVERFGEDAEAFFALLKEAGGFEFERAIGQQGS